MAIFPDPNPAENQYPYLNTFQIWGEYLSRMGLAYVGLVFMLVGWAIANACNERFNPDHEVDNPISGIIRSAKQFIGLVGMVIICAALIERNPFYFIGGLGAFMAIIMLVFRDYLLGLVASIQIISNRVATIGDWIEMPKYNANGHVLEMSLLLIKVQNFDNTISTIPTHAVLSESFRNWTGMQIAGGRRIKRSVLIDMRSIQVCTPEMIERFENMELIRSYINEKKGLFRNHNSGEDVEVSLANTRQLTNIGTFRVYLEAYLRGHPKLNTEMMILIRHLQPTDHGLPVEIIAFCTETIWDKFEAVQADIFDHILAVMPEFGLRVFQDVPDENR